MKLYTPKSDGWIANLRQHRQFVRNPRTPPIQHLTRSATSRSRSIQTLCQCPVQSHTTMADPTSCAFTSSAPYQGSLNRTAVVVGGGPAGCLAAMLLAQQGWQVHVMEMRDEESAVGSRSKLRSWAIAIFSRGINAILAAVPDAGGFFRSRSYEALVINRTDGSVRWRMERKEAGTALVHRADVAALLTRAMQRHGDAIALHYGARFTCADFDARTASFQIEPGAQEAAGKLLTLPYEVLVGADGAWSAVRACLLQAFPSQLQLTMLSPSDGRVYKAFHGMPPDPQALRWNPGHVGAAAAAAALDAGHPPSPDRPSDPGICFNVFPTTNPGIGISVSFDVDQGTYSGSFPMLEHLLPTPHDSEEAWFTWLDAVAFPPLPRSWHRLLAAQLAQGPVSRLAHVQRTSRFTVWGTGAVLIGDAAHTVTPALGQGINSALEDAVLLAQALQPTSCPADVDSALEAFNAARLPQIAAMQVLELSIRALSAPLLQGTWLGKTIARLRGKHEQPGLFGESTGTIWLRVRFVLYFIGKVSIAAVLRLVLGRRRAHAWLPWLLKGPPLIETQTGDIDYVTMVRVLDVYGLVMGGAAALGALVLARNHLGNAL